MVKQATSFPDAAKVPMLSPVVRLTRGTVTFRGSGVRRRSRRGGLHHIHGPTNRDGNGGKKGGRALQFKNDVSGMRFVSDRRHGNHKKFFEAPLQTRVLHGQTPSGPGIPRHLESRRHTFPLSHPNPIPVPRRFGNSNPPSSH